MGLPINFSFSGFDANYCFTSYNQFGLDLVQRLSGQTDGDGTFFNDGDTTPSPDNRIYPWTPPSYSLTIPPAFIYHYVDGAWLMPHPIPSGVGLIDFGTIGNIDTYDGGEAGTITDTTGPMWEVVSEMAARFPIGAGTLPSTTVLAVGDTGGEEEVELEEEHLPVNEIQGYTLQSGANLSSVQIIADDDRNSTAAPNPVHSFGGNPDGTTEPHNNMPPYRVVRFIRRTARKYYRRPA